MSDPSSISTLELADFPASHIIESFGGVRPLAKKLDLAASTVQGWKLRDHIPEHYHHRLKNLLQEDAIDLFADKPESVIANDAARPVLSVASQTAPRPLPLNPNAAYFAMPQSTLKYWVMSALSTLGLLALVTLILLVVFFGRDFFAYMTAEHDVATLAPPVAIAPAPVPPPSDTMQTDLQQSRDAIDTTLDSVKKIKQDAGPQQTELVAQIDRIEKVVGSLRDRVDQMDKALKEKGVDTRAIRDQINDLSRRDVMAAALLLGVAQIHGMLDNQANFSQDLAFLKALMANDPAMIKSLDKLAPFAEKGLMTREQMMETLDMVSKETIKVSIDNPNLTWSQKIWTALSNVIEVRKKAPDIAIADTSTPNGQITEAKNYLSDDNFAMAAQVLQEYHGPGADEITTVMQNMQGRDAALAIMDELINKSQGLLNLDQIKNLIGNPASVGTPFDGVPATQNGPVY